MTEDRFNDYMRKYIRSTYRTQVESSAALGCSPAYLSAMLSGNRAPSLAILNAMNCFRRVSVTFHKEPKQ